MKKNIIPILLGLLALITLGSVSYLYSSLEELKDDFRISQEKLIDKEKEIKKELAEKIKKEKEEEEKNEKEIESITKEAIAKSVKQTLHDIKNAQDEETVYFIYDRVTGDLDTEKNAQEIETLANARDNRIKELTKQAAEEKKKKEEAEQARKEEEKKKTEADKKAKKTDQNNKPKTSTPKS